MEGYFRVEVCVVTDSDGCATFLQLKELQNVSG